VGHCCCRHWQSPHQHTSPVPLSQNDRNATLNAYTHNMQGYHASFKMEPAAAAVPSPMVQASTPQAAEHVRSQGGVWE
jgi:hypothetical protein